MNNILKMSVYENVDGNGCNIADGCEVLQTLQHQLLPGPSWATRNLTENKDDGRQSPASSSNSVSSSRDSRHNRLLVICDNYIT